MTAEPTPPPPFALLHALFGDARMAEVFSERRTIEAWLQTEAALARAQAKVGVLDAADAEAITEAAVLDVVDVPRLWRESRNVGYPVLPLVRMIAEALPHGPNGRVHYGATTQDIMDTGLALQLVDALDRLETLVCALGDALAELVDRHRGTVMAARTHGQQAVPTTFGAKMAVFLDQFARHLERVERTRGVVGKVSLYGAGGTSAALGEAVAEIRDAMAEDLGLGSQEVPWHVARDGLADFGHVAASLAATCARLAREVVDLSRTEVAEAYEPAGHHRGASSTMPQKVNPVASEAVIGMAVTAQALAGPLYRAMEAGHERAAGEWQVEWQVVPQLATLTAGCLDVSAEVVSGLQVRPETMRHNLGLDGGLIMAEAHMMRLSGALGRERAHDVVYEAAGRSRRVGGRLEDALRAMGHAGGDDGEVSLDADAYLGATTAVCQAALGAWRDARTTATRRSSA